MFEGYKADFSGTRVVQVLQGRSLGPEVEVTTPLSRINTRQQTFMKPWFSFNYRTQLVLTAQLKLRDLEGSYFCFTDQSMAALVWLRAAMLSSVPGVEIHLHTSHSILLLPVWYLRRRKERARQSMTGRGTLILSSIVTLKSASILIPIKGLIVVLETFLAGNTKENCKSLKLVSVHDRNKAG